MPSQEQIWLQTAKKELRGKDPTTLETTSAQIKIKRLYSSADLKKRSFQESFPGSEPFARGVKATMYTGKEWTIRQYAGFSTASESNKFYKQCLEKGQKGLSVAFDLPTHRGYDSDHPEMLADVGKAGVAIDSVEDMKELFHEIDLEKVSVSMTMNGAVLPILASYIVTAREQGAETTNLKGTIQNDILKEYLVRNTYIYPPQESLRIVGDIIEYSSKQLPHFNPISISGYHMQEAGADPALELAYTICNANEYLDVAISRGMKIDDFAPRLSFFFGIGMDFFMEIAKLRAARIIWSQTIKKYNPKNPKSLLLRTHCQTSGYSLTEKQPHNNIVRTTLEALASVMGGTQSLHTNSFDEAIALPTDFSAQIARNTQLILQKETEISKTVDPFGGSYFMESLTLDLVEKVYEIIAEIKEAGGMLEAISSGLARLRIEESATIKQARIDSKQEQIIGVNSFVPKQEPETPIETRTIDNHLVRETQIKKLQHLKKSRDQQKVDQILAKLKESAGNKKNNLLEVTIEAMAARATVGEVSSALAEVFSRYQVNSQTLTSVYSKHMEKDSTFKKTKDQVDKFFEKNGRRPRILIAKLGQDGHDRGARVVASGLSDLGFDVDLGPLFQTPEQVVKQACENDVHVIGVSSQAGGHNTLVLELSKCLKKNNAQEIKIILGGIIPEKDRKFLLKQGVSVIFTPGANIAECGSQILEVI
jgi:methylmalonyl-CoA mutase